MRDGAAGEGATAPARSASASTADADDSSGVTIGTWDGLMKKRAQNSYKSFTATSTPHRKRT